MLLKIITPERTELETETESVTLPATGGQITILPGHAALVCALEAGEMIAKINGVDTSFFITEGAAQIIDNEVTVLADIATKAADLTEAKVMEARAAAVETKAKQSDDVDFATIDAALRRELAKEKILDKYKKRTRPVG